MCNNFKIIPKIYKSMFNAMRSVAIIDQIYCNSR